jgi:hypothetical protein
MWHYQLALAMSLDRLSGTDSEARRGSSDARSTHNHSPHFSQIGTLPFTEF